MHEKINEKIKYMMEKKPEKLLEFVKKVYQHNPEVIEEMLENYEEFGHVTSEHKYKELTQRLKWKNGQGKGERWKSDDIKRFSRINFENEDFTEFDFAYLVNMLYSKCCKEFTDLSFYVKLAKCFLEDDDEETKMYRGAEHHQKKSPHYGPQSRYEDYDEEARRRRHYRNEADYRYDDYRNEDYKYEDARRYRNEDYRNEDYRRYRNKTEDYDSRYRDNKIGFHIDS